MFYLYRQNNSGGHFSGTVEYVVEANSTEEADTMAEATGTVYFHGVAAGKDCQCCGNRWHPAYSFDEYETLEEALGSCYGYKNLTLVTVLMADGSEVQYDPSTTTSD